MLEDFNIEESSLCCDLTDLVHTAPGQEATVGILAENTWMTPHKQFRDMLHFFSVVFFFTLVFWGHRICPMGEILSILETPEWLHRLEAKSTKDG